MHNQTTKLRHTPAFRLPPVVPVGWPGRALGKLAIATGLLCAVVSAVPGHAQPADSTMLHVGQTKQFFFDNLIIESSRDLTRKMHKPVRQLAEPVIRKDQPWEHVTYFTVSSWRVIWDEPDKEFKCWYEDWCVNQLPMGKEPQADPLLRPSRYLFAHSRDGVKWEKPLLGIVKEHGMDTNIVFGDPRFGTVHAGYVFIDPAETQLGHRFKMIYNHRLPGSSTQVYELATSPDGKRWSPSGRPLNIGRFGNRLGDVLAVSIDPHSGIYRINVRHPEMMNIPGHASDPYLPRYDRVRPGETVGSFMSPVYPGDPGRENRRRVFQIESGDLHNWTNPRPLVVPDAAVDNIDEAFYGMTQMPIGDAWVGFLHVLRMTENTMHTQLMFSRDGVQFQRVQPGQPWLEGGGPGSWDELMVNVYGQPVQVGDELFVYYGGSRNHHDWWLEARRENLDVVEGKDLSSVNYALGLLRMKVDRFVSLRALPVREGTLVTRPFSSQGNELVVNVQCREGGYVKVAVADAEGKVLPGFEAENCEVFKGDATGHAVRWRGNPFLPADRKFIKLYFFMRDADLFSFQTRTG